jgi:hemolysin activation/secretion protein
MKKLITTCFFLFCANAFAQNINNNLQQNIINQQNQILQRQNQEELDFVRQKELKKLSQDKEKFVKEEKEEFDIEEEKLRLQDGKIVQDYTNLRCYHIDKIEFSKNKLISKSQENKLIATRQNKCLSSAQIIDLANEITNYLIAQGYSTSRAEVPKQNLNDGVLQIEIIESFLEEIIFDDDDFANKMRKFVVFGLYKKGDVLNIKEIEEALDQVNRLQSSNATIKIIPGKIANHSIVLIETFSQKPLSLNFSYNNSGAQATGEMRETIGFSYDNLFNLNDVISFQRSSNDLDEKRNERGASSISGSLALFFKNYSLNLSYAKSDYFLFGGDSVRFKSSGETSNKTASLDYDFSKSKKTKIVAGISLTNRYNRNFINDVRLDNSSRKTSFVTAHYSQSFFLKNATLFLKPSFSKTVNIFDSQKDEAGIASAAAHSEFEIFRFYGNYQRNLNYFNRDFSYNLIVEGQQSNKRLFGIDQFAVGGFFSVRGFQNASISGDSGYSVRNEVTFSLNQLINIEKLQLHRFYLTPFYDYGFVRFKGGNSSGRMSGAGAKLAFYQKNFDANFTYARALSNSRLLPSEDLKDDEAFYFNLNLKF